MSGKLYIKTHGCQMNEYDSDKMADVLAASHGLELTDSEAEADVILINTCSIREKAQEKVFSQLGRWKQLKRDNPQLVIGVGGCVASQEGEALVKRAPFVDLVFGPQTLHRLPGMLEMVRENGRAVVPHDPAASPLYQQMTRNSRPFMPFGKPKLPDEQLELVRRWIVSGASLAAVDEVPTAGRAVEAVHVLRHHHVHSAGSFQSHDCLVDRVRLGGTERGAVLEFLLPVLPTRLHGGHEVLVVDRPAGVPDSLRTPIVGDARCRRNAGSREDENPLVVRQQPGEPLYGGVVAGHGRSLRCSVGRGQRS